MFFESQVSKICNSDLNLPLTDVEPKYPVQCSEDGNWHIPTEKMTELMQKVTSHHAAMFLLVITSSPHHSVVTQMTSGVLKSF